MDERFYAVILAGGRGERFWPLSTARKPKQLLSLVGGRPLIAQAVDRLESMIPSSRVFIITNKDLVAATREAVPNLPAGNVVGEPVGRDTAAAIALGAALVRARHPDAAFCVLTADHIMGDIPLYRKTLLEALNLASAQEVLVTIGMRPSDPNTGYGYIEAGDRFSESNGIAFFRARRFVEKPDRETAEQYLRAGRYFWNSGMFIWSVRSLENAFRKFRPALVELMKQIGAAQAAEVPAVLDREFGKLEKISIDYALMEKADNIIMARGEFAWDDVGSWTALENHLPKDAAGNAVTGRCESVDSNDNIVVSGDRLTALVGVSGLVVVQSGGVTLVCPKERAQDVKKLVEKLKASGSYGEVL